MFADMLEWEQTPDKNFSRERSAGCPNRWNAHFHEHTCVPRCLYQTEKRNNSALHSESPLIVPSHEISALAKKQAQKGRQKQIAQTHADTHTPSHIQACQMWIWPGMCLSLYISPSLCQCKDSLVLLIGAWWAQCHEGADVKLWSSPLLHNSCFIGPIPCGVMRPIKSVSR